MNSFTAVGRLATDPHRKQVGGGQVCEFVAAVDTGKEAAIFIRCSAWGKKGEFIHQYFAKGKPIAFTGSISDIRAYIPNSGGDPRTSTDLRVSEVSFVPGVPKDNTAKPAPAATPEPAEDIPPF